MAQFPKRTKHRKQQKGKMKGFSKAGNFVTFGEYGIQSMGRGWITMKQIEAARVAISRFFARKGKVWIKIFPDKPISKKPAETRMGKGKGSPSEWVATAKPGRVLFEVGEVTREDAQHALRRAAAKLPVKTRFVERREQPRG